MSTIASPLYVLMSNNNVKFKWNSEKNEAFKVIKSLLLSNTVLTHYISTLELVLACDASPTGVGAALSHKFPNDVEKPIAFTSRTLTNAEKAYS